MSGTIAFGPDDRLAIITACTMLGAERNQLNIEPLGPQGWSKVAIWLHERGLRPGNLFDPSIYKEAESPFNAKTTENLASLAERATLAALELEGLQSRGLWALVRFDQDYPIRWKEQLKSAAPPVIFGAGPDRLLNQSGMAIVGSREIDEQLQEIANQLGSLISGTGSVVISGGARGSDRWGMNGALEREGNVLGILSGDLDRLTRQSDIRRYIEEGRLTLVSHVHPRTGFSAGNAMSRNKYIHALAEATFVIATTEGKGGTWSGSLENIRGRWSPLLVWTGVGAPAANQALVTAGGYPFSDLPASGQELQALIDEARSIEPPVAEQHAAPLQRSLFDPN